MPAARATTLFFTHTDGKPYTPDDVERVGRLIARGAGRSGVDGTVEAETVSQPPLSRDRSSVWCGPLEEPFEPPWPSSCKWAAQQLMLEAIEHRAREILHRSWMQSKLRRRLTLTQPSRDGRGWSGVAGAAAAAGALMSRRCRLKGPSCRRENTA